LRAGQSSNSTTAQRTKVLTFGSFRAWAQFARADKSTCIASAAIDGFASYVELLSCLEMARDVKNGDSNPSGPHGNSPLAGKTIRSRQLKTCKGIKTRSPTRKSRTSPPTARTRQTPSLARWAVSKIRLRSGKDRSPEHRGRPGRTAWKLGQFEDFERGPKFLIWIACIVRSTTWLGDRHSATNRSRPASGPPACCIRPPATRPPRSIATNPNFLIRSFTKAFGSS
jgi:hypothetical protein